MGIWKAELFLLYDINDKWILKFFFGLQDEKYKNNEYNDQEWVYSKGWLSDKIPKNMVASPCTSGYKVVQGFDHKLSEVELEQLQKDMVEGMRKYLDIKKENYLKMHDCMIQTLKGDIS